MKIMRKLVRMLGGKAALANIWHRYISPCEGAPMGETRQEYEYMQMLYKRIEAKNAERRAMFDRRLAAQQEQLVLAEQREAREREREVWS